MKFLTIRFINSYLKRELDIVKLKTKESLKNIEREIVSLILLFTIFLTTYIIIFLATTTFGATPKLVNKLNNAFEDIESWIIKISTPAAAVAVCTGALMRKFSFGDEEKIRTGKSRQDPLPRPKRNERNDPESR